MGSGFKGKVALNGDPTQAGSAFSGVQMASVGNGGTVSNVTPGVDYFSKLKKAGNLLPVDPDPTTIESGQTPVVIDWDYLNAAESKKLKTWKVVVPDNAVIAGYYYQAINKDAPHPAAAQALAGVPLLRPGSEPLARRWCATGSRRRDGQGRHDRQDGVRRLATRQRKGDHADRR